MVWAWVAGIILYNKIWVHNRPVIIITPRSRLQNRNIWKWGRLCEFYMFVVKWRVLDPWQWSRVWMLMVVMTDDGNTISFKEVRKLCSEHILCVICEGRNERRMKEYNGHNIISHERNTGKTIWNLKEKTQICKRTTESNRAEPWGHIYLRMILFQGKCFYNSYSQENVPKECWFFEEPFQGFN